MLKIEAALVAKCHSGSLLAEQVCQHLLALGGKRIRAKLVMLSADVCQSNSDDAEQLAVIVEWLHAATLLHDDVIDDADQRRHKSSAKQVFGNSASILAGDFLYSLAFQSIANLNHIETIKVLSEATQLIVEGEIQQLSNRHALQGLDSYLAIIGGKTAKLFEVAAALPAIYSKSDSEVVNGLKIFGYNFGLAYQVVDDIIDCFAAAADLGKPKFQDLKTGICTLPLILALDGASAEFKAQAKKALEGDLAAQVATQKHIASSKLLLEKSIVFAEELVEVASNSLAKIASGDSLSVMNSMLVEVLQRLKSSSFSVD